MEVIELIEIKTTKRAVEEVHEVLGHSGVLVNVVSIRAVCDAGEPKDDNNEHHGKHEKMDRTVENSGPQDDNVTHKGKSVEDEKYTKE